MHPILLTLENFFMYVLFNSCLWALHLLGRILVISLSSIPNSPMASLRLSQSWSVWKLLYGFTVPLTFFGDNSLSFRCSFSFSFTSFSRSCALASSLRCWKVSAATRGLGCDSGLCLETDSVSKFLTFWSGLLMGCLLGWGTIMDGLFYINNNKHTNSRDI